MKRKLLSKSKYINGLQCLRYLWLQFNDKVRIPEVDASTQHVFDEGHRIGQLAKKLFPEGIDLSSEDFIGNLNQTRRLLEQRKPLFESSFYVDGYYSRLDVLVPVEDEQWDIYEVKGSTSVKEIHIPDTTFQRHCALKAGLEINKCFVVHINNQYVRQGEIDVHELFAIEDVTEQVWEIAPVIEDQAEDMWEAIESSTCPEIGIGPHCSDPYDCPVTWCKECLPEHNIFNLYRGGKKCFDLFDQGIFFVKDIPTDFKLSTNQQIQQTCEITEAPHIDLAALREFLDSLEYPLYYLDFETFNPAIPPYVGTRPYQQIPFQFSLHIVTEPNAEPVHQGFLADAKGDPRPEFLAQLQTMLGSHGSIIVYNQSFEKRILKELGNAFPEQSKWVEGITNRIIDLYLPFRDFSYYHPQQQGSASLKKVLPALTGRGYGDLEINNGDEASRTFFNMVMCVYSEDEVRRARENLGKYCGLDTEGMIWVQRELEKFVM